MQTLSFLPVQDAASIETLAALAAPIWREHFTPIIGAAQVAYMLEKFQSVPALTAQIAAGYQYYLLTAGVPVGYTGLQYTENALFLSKLYLQKAARGQGYARQAMDFLVSLAQAQGLPRIRLTVNKNNTDTISIYRHLGFVCTDAVITDIGGGFVMDDYILEKTVKGEEKICTAHTQ